MVFLTAPLAGGRPGLHHRAAGGNSSDANGVSSKRTTDPDSSLVARMADGDDSALAALYDRHGRLAYSLAFGILGDGAEAEEAVADAFLQIWTSAASFDAARSSVAGWLTMIVRTRALDRLRSRRRRGALIERVTVLEGVDAARPVATEAADALAERSQTGQRVAAAIESLPPAQRKVIELAFFGGLSHSEIAQELGEPLGTVKTRIRTAMERLRTALAPHMAAE
jgi:RNA polymerase sigma-70 factor (ECF subfamily)